MTWFPIFFAGFLAGWWMCAATWPLSGRRPRRPPEGSYGPCLDPGCIQRGNAGNNPTTPKPEIIPKPQPASGGRHQWMHDLRPDLTREPFVYQPRPQQGTPNPPPSEP